MRDRLQDNSSPAQDASEPIKGSDLPFPDFYDELRGLARRILGNRGNDTLAPTALVHETYLRLSHTGHSRHLALDDFFKLAGRAMRSVLVDHVRRKRSLKRGGESRRQPLDDAASTYEQRAIDLVSLDDALKQLEALDPQLSHLIELRFFCGLKEDEIAEIWGVSSRTIRRNWRTAKAWLRQHMAERGLHVN